MKKCTVKTTEELEQAIKRKEETIVAVADAAIVLKNLHNTRRFLAGLVKVVPAFLGVLGVLTAASLCTDGIYSILRLGMSLRIFSGGFFTLIALGTIISPFISDMYENMFRGYEVDDWNAVDDGGREIVVLLRGAEIFALQ